MADAADPPARQVEPHLRAHQRSSRLRFLTCGGSDDGKSTLIGRMLYEARLLFDDQLAALAADSQRIGTQDGKLDFALLLDGLGAEREQGITIDVAYRFFSTDRRHFIVADTPGHEQYTRNMVTGASTASVAVMLVDARKGVQTQTRRHSHLVALFGIRKVVLAINKLDLLDYSREAFERIAGEYRTFAHRIGLEEPTAIPLSALHGDNVTTASANTPWYRGPTLIDFLETVEVEDVIQQAPFRMPVQWVNRTSPDFRGFAGRVVSGVVRRGERIRVLPSGIESTVARIVTMDGDLEQAVAGLSVTLTLADGIDVSRGDMIAVADAPPGVADQFEATVVWMSEHEMLPGRRCLLRIGTNTVGVTMAAPKYRVDVDAQDHLAAKTLKLNEIGVCNLHLDRRVAFDPYRENRETGGFVLIDRFSNETIGAGLLHFALRRSANIHWQALDVGKPARAERNGHLPCVIWFTGLSGSGKTTIANLVEKRLMAMGCHTYLLDGDNLRHGLNRDLGFTAADRVENIRRVTEVAALMVDAGLIVLVSFISPFRAERQAARERMGPGEFCEVFVDTPLEVAEQRDPKGLYRKARAGQLQNFTGIDSPYEPPDRPEIRIETTATSAEDAANTIVEHIRGRGVLRR